MPRPDPLPSPRRSTIRRFRRIMRWMALVALGTAIAAVVLVARGQGEAHVHLLIATALGVALTVLLGTALMTLAFLSASSGHDEQAATAATELADEEEEQGG